MRERAYLSALGRILDEQGRRQKWLADRIGMTESSMSRSCNGIRSLNEYEAGRIARLLDCDVDELLERR